MDRGYFQYYETFEKIVSKFKTEEAKNAFRAKIVAYGLFGIQPELNELEDMVWDIVKDMIDDQQHRRQVNAENRKKKPAAEKSEQPGEEIETTDNESEENETPANENIIPFSELKRNEEKRNETDCSETEKPTPRFKKPTVEEVAEYCQERHNGLNAERFVDYYESKGWLVGKNKMKDWKAAVRNWETRPNTSPPQNQERMLPADRLIL